jgi:hypothetical protein
VKRILIVHRHGEAPDDKAALKAILVRFEGPPGNVRCTRARRRATKARAKGVADPLEANVAGPPG